jgi:3-oxoacyl-(acyl-carrier-protein) synthase
MQLALDLAGWWPTEVDYINAHATSTPTGDVSECRALHKVFTEKGAYPDISSTKALTGHALSLSSIMEAAFCLLGMKEGFTPGSAHISELDKEAEGLGILRETKPVAPRHVLSNSSGFGGTNVVLGFSSS